MISAPRSPRLAPPRTGGGAPARALFFILAAAGALLPLWLLRRMARAVARAAWSLSPRLRRGLDSNARHLLAAEEVSPAASRALSLAQLRSFADFTSEVAASAAGRVSVEDILAGVEGTENLALATPGGRGVVGVTLHLGNYEMAARALAGRVRGGAVVVYDRDPGRRWEERRTAWRRSMGVEQIAIDASPYFGIEVLARLRKGAAVLLAGDQVEFREGEEISLLGAPANFSVWPARLALAAEVAILPAFTTRGPDGRYTLHLEKPIDPRGREPRAILEDLVAVYERYLRRYREQWLMVRGFWKERE